MPQQFLVVLSLPGLDDSSRSSADTLRAVFGRGSQGGSPLRDYPGVIHPTGRAPAVRHGFEPTREPPSSVSESVGVQPFTPLEGTSCRRNIGHPRRLPNASNRRIRRRHTRKQPVTRRASRTPPRPRFATVVNDIVVEFGSSRYQAVMDRFVSGGEVPYAELRKAWQDTFAKKRHDFLNVPDTAARGAGERRPEQLTLLCQVDSRFA